MSLSRAIDISLVTAEKQANKILKHFYCHSVLVK